eukprot:TRINITY_DN3035_c0_g1_i1.p1 TRINITY_DN3035_c0_g1~~TRINITY_DN3035_c0_g1_i1.p1  ORF type:complete len:316 (+),score=57.74 TRINITY_DN3035_c0_g1_i1:202-1149(+)
MRTSAVGNNKTLQKLERTVQEGNYYEAQQMYKSIHARYMAANKYTEALDLIQSGVTVQLRHGQVTCGAELALIFVDTLRRAKIKYGKETLDRITSIFNEFPCTTVPHKISDDEDFEALSDRLARAKTCVDGCSSFLKAAIKWSAENGGPKRGAPELHDMLAQYTWSQSTDWDIAKVSMHFVQGSQPKAFAAALCYPGEADVAIARGVLLYLSSGNLRDANVLMDALVDLSREKQIELPNTPLLQFITYLLLTLERDALPLFQMLRQNYKTSIDREPSFNELLDEIAERFYKVQRRTGLQSLLGGMFKMMEGMGAS